MADYTLIGPDGTEYELGDVVFDEVNDTVSFGAQFRQSPGDPSQLRRNSDGSIIPIVINNFTMHNGQVRWSALALVGPR